MTKNLHFPSSQSIWKFALSKVTGAKSSCMQILSPRNEQRQEQPKTNFRFNSIGQPKKFTIKLSRIDQPKNHKIDTFQQYKSEWTQILWMIL